MGLEILPNLDLMRAITKAQAGDSDFTKGSGQSKPEVEEDNGDDVTSLREYFEPLGKGQNIASVKEDSERVPTRADKGDSL